MWLKREITEAMMKVGKMAANRLAALFFSGLRKNELIRVLVFVAAVLLAR